MSAIKKHTDARGHQVYTNEIGQTGYLSMSGNPIPFDVNPGPGIQCPECRLTRYGVDMRLISAVDRICVPCIESRMLRCKECSNGGIAPSGFLVLEYICETCDCLQATIEAGQEEQGPRPERIGGGSTREP
jgi:hypothetical protein